MGRDNGREQERSPDLRIRAWHGKMISVEALLLSGALDGQLEVSCEGLNWTEATATRLMAATKAGLNLG